MRGRDRERLSAREKSSFKDTVEAWTGCSHLTVSTPPGEVMKVKWRGVRSLPLSLPYASFSAFSRRWPLAGVASFLPPSNTCSSKQHRSTWGPGGFSRACWSSSPMGRTRWTRTLAPGSNPLTASPGQCPTTATWPISSIFYEPRPFSWTWVIEEVISWEDSRVYVRRAQSTSSVSVFLPSFLDLKVIIVRVNVQILRLK